MALIGDPIPNYVQRQIQVRQASYGSGAIPGSIRTDNDLIYQNSNNAFIKMASGVSVSSSKLEEIGFSATEAKKFDGMDLAKNYVLFGGTAQMGKFSQTGNGVLFQKTDFLGNQGAYDSSPDFGIVPMPGIESLEVKSLNRGSLKKATVKLTAQTREQLAILDILYMRLGYTVLLEWGNSIYITSTKNKDKNIEEGRLQQMYTSIIEDNSLFFNPSWSKGRSYSDITKKISKVRELYDGNFDALLGKVSNFNWSFNPDGSYSIELTVISLGDVVESLKTNVVASSETLGFVEKEGLEWKNESSTLDQHRKDNIILSLLHVFRWVNANPKGINLTIETEGETRSYLGYLLESGSAQLTTGEYTITETITVGFKNINTGEWINPETDLEFGYWDETGLKINEDDALIKANAKSSGLGSNLDDYKGYGYNVSSTYGGRRAGVVFAFNFANYTDSKSSPIINTGAWNDYKLSVAKQNADATGTYKTLEDGALATNPAVIFRKDWIATYEKPPHSSITDKIPLPTKGGADGTIEGKSFLQPLFATRRLSVDGDWATVQNSLSNSAGRALFSWEVNRVDSVDNIGTFDNVLIRTGYKPQDACVINLDIPQYYIRLGYLLDLLKQKVITRIKKVNKTKYNDNPNLFDIDTSDNQKMLCLPKVHISYDWRICIVRRDDFNRSTWNQKVFPELKEWVSGSSNTADPMNIYMNFNYVADTMVSNMDERGNVSVYDFTKGLCDGINKAMAGVNNLEPVIDEDTNTLNILDSSPIPRTPPTPEYTLQLYGYGNGAINPQGTSTFVRKVDLKTAITPEYATMITVGATANGYVKGVEATAFARWNEGLIDRFKTELIAADQDTKSQVESREDTAKSFFEVLAWSSKCFGIEGNGRLWETFKNPTNIIPVGTAASNSPTAFATATLTAAGLIGFGGTP